MKNKALVLLLAAVFLKQLVWSTFVPLWQTPDEQAHFAQISAMAETGLTYQSGNNTSKEILISEQIMGTQRDQFGNNRFTYHSEFKPEYAVEKEKLISNLPKTSRTEFVKQEATSYPPLYYQLGSLIYRIFYNGSLFDRVFMVRIFTGLTLVALTYFTFKIGKLIFNDENRALILAVLVGFQPMIGFVHSGVTSDTLFNLLFTIFIFLGVKTIVSGLTIRNLVLMGAIVWLATITKPQANIMFFIALPLLLTLVIRDKKIKLSFIVIGSLISLIASREIIYRLINGWNLFPDSETKQIYLSITPIEHLVFTARHTINEVLPWYWGVFRWLSLGLPDILRKITNWLTIVSFAGFGCYLVTVKKDRRFWAIIFCAISMLAYFAAITAFDYSFRQAHGFSFGIQGRYFFPVIVGQMVIFYLGLKPFGRLLGIGMVLLNALVFIWVIGSYYQLNFATFFIEASQYKPLWLKWPVNLVILVSAIVTNIWICLLLLRPTTKKT